MVASETGALRTSRFRKAQGFYARVLSAAEALALEEAMKVDGLDEEIALLRLRLQQAAAERPEDIELMFKGAALLARMLATKFGLTKDDAGDLNAAIDRAIASLTELHEREAADE